MLFTMGISGGAFADFFSQNPEFDLRKHDFFKKTPRSQALLSSLSAGDIEILKTYQRLQQVTDDPHLADRLVKAGLVSAHHIAQQSEDEFVEKQAARLNIDLASARLLHRTAVQAKLRAQLTAFALKGSVGSAFYRAGAMNTANANLTELIEAIPSYQDFFGSLDYCSCDPDQSIFSPSAYMVDMLRIVYQYIDNTTYNAGIPNGWHLSERRPDIEKIPLTPEMTRQLVPYLQIINEVLEASIATSTGWNDVFRELTDQPYPFVLPFILPLTQTRIYCAALGPSLLNIYQTFQARAATPATSELPGPLAIGREALGLNPTTTQIVTTTLASAETIGPYYGIGDGRLLKRALSGTVSVAKGVNTVTGDGTDFINQVKVGDFVQLGPQRAQVLSVDSATRLTTIQLWSIDAAASVMMDIPSTDLGLSLVFTQRTGLDFEQLQALLNQQLSAQEQAAGLGTSLFINKGLTADKCLSVTVDRSDSSMPVSRIANLDLAALDRLNRFIRLANASALPYVDLDWLIQTLGQGRIDSDAVSAIGRTLALAQRLGCSVEEALGLFQPLKTIGIDDPGRPLDMFDQLFNSSSILGSTAGALPAFTAKGTVSLQGTAVTGTDTTFKQQIEVGMRVRVAGELKVVATVASDVALTVTSAFAQTTQHATMVVIPTANTPSDALPVYHPIYTGNILYQDIVADWAPDEPTVPNSQLAELRSRLRAGLNVVDDDLTAIGQRVLASLVQTGALKQNATQIPLSVPNLSVLYSYAKFARQTKLTVGEYLILLDLLEIPVVADLDGAIGVADWASWLKESHLNVYALDYSLRGTVSKHFTPMFTVAALPDVLAALWQTAQDWLVLGAGFINQDISAEQSQVFFDRLCTPQAGFLSVHGAVLEKAVDFTSVAFVDPLDVLSFVSAKIDPQQSKEAFEELVSHKVLSSTGVLAASFTAETDLSFLFASQSDRQPMIAQVQAQLLLVKGRIEHVVAVLLTYGGAPDINHPNRGVQRFQLSEQLGVALGSDTGTLLALGPNIAETVGLTDYVAAFLQPPVGQPGKWAPPSTAIRDFMVLMARIVTLNQQLGFNASDITFVTDCPAPFGVAALNALTLDNVRAMWGYKRLREVWDDTKERLSEFFSLPVGQDCLTDKKTEVLSTLSGWPVSQICRLRSTLYGTSTDYNTVQGLVAMKACFDTAAGLGLDIDGTLSLARLNIQPAQVDTSTWTKYSAASTATIGSLKARYGNQRWETVYRPIENAVNEAKRDVLTPYAIYTLNRKFAAISNIDELYAYLLIDTQMSGCSDISYIKQALLSVQLYMQRARMMLEPGISKLSIPETWWNWMGSYPLWEANRKVFLYPENYLEPQLRLDKTPQFQTIQDNLTANDITPTTVNDAYVDYFETFESLAQLKPVSSYYGIAPDPSSQGTLTPMLYLLSRTATEPYTYYLQRRIDTTGWTAFDKVDLLIPTPIVAPLYAYDRLFLFWVEQDTTSASMVQGGNANNSADTGATLKYSFINFSGKWTSPQTLDHFVINFDPMQGGYSTPQINPADFHVNRPEWRTVTPMLVKGKNGAQDSIIVNYGWFYDLPGNAPQPPVAPDPRVITNPDAMALAQTLYNSSKYAVAASNQGVRGATYANQSRLLLNGLDVSPTYPVLGAYDLDFTAPKPYLPQIPRTVVASNQVPLMRITDFDNIFLINAVGQGASDTWVPSKTVEVLFNVSDRAGFTNPVINQPLWFLWDNGDESFILRSTEPGIKRLEEYVSVLAGSEVNQTKLISGHYTDTPASFENIVWSVERLSTGAIARLSRALFSGGVPKLLSPSTQVAPTTPTLPFSRFYNQGAPSHNIKPPLLLDGDAIDYKGPYGLYFWEIYFYGPWMIASQLQANQRFAEARQWFEYIFNPTVPVGSDPTVKDQNDRFWQLVAFRDLSVEHLKDILTDPLQIQAYNNHPFEPHVIARLRGTAYPKAIVMRYVGLLLDWGDFEYTKDTWESVNQATLLYIVARELLGPRPVDVGSCATGVPSTFKDIQTKYGTDIPQFLIDMENVSKLAETAIMPLDSSDRYVPFNDLDSYFCVPENSDLMKYWDMVEQRLFKIRHCMNIHGVVRQLALFEPPIDPMALVRAAASGAGSKVVDQLQAGAPPYRFTTIFRMAKDFTQQLSQIGTLLLGALEKNDAEAVARLSAGQQIQILNLTTKSMDLQIAEAKERIVGLQISNQAVTARQDFYQALIDEGLIPAEQLQVAMVILSNVLSTTSTVMNGLSSGAFLIPNAGSPFAMTYGGREIGNSLKAAASIFEVMAQITKGVGDVSQMVSGFERREQEWQQALTQAKYDVQVLDSQIVASNLQLQTLQQQLATHRQTLTNAAEVDDFLRKKFTNVELYQWMVARLSTVYGQAYRMALELAVSAQQAYQFEINSIDRFITFDYWDGLHKGLLAGEQLMISLSQMEAAYYRNNTRSFEIEKTISLLALDPEAFVRFQNTGVCDVLLSEYLFDLDYPGHFARQVKSISITIPAILGPNQNIKATLTQTGSQILIKPDIDGVDYLLGLSSQTPDTSVLRANWRASQKVTLSSGIDDAGMFQFDLNDERYLPFEGTGAIGAYRLEMPKESNRIDYASMTDVVIRLRYTALDGGAPFANEVRSKINNIPYRAQRAFNLGANFPTQWFGFAHPPSDAVQQTFSVVMARGWFPANLGLNQVVEIDAMLQLADGISLGGNLVTSLEIGSGANVNKVPLTFNAANGVAMATGLGITGWVDQPWSLIVTKSGVPSGISAPNTGWIDPTKLISIGLLVSYTANRP
ncbi:MAG: neuraminidase-like domain-containing protein [Pseudomonas piscis]|uniref:Tc toxin subunit A-related protein n=1 Tax=Pseudomonas piscis TaxID=2614538 RepID=UPI003D269CC6